MMNVSFKKSFKIFIYLLIVVFPNTYLKAESGYRLWLRYDLVSNSILLTQYRSGCKEFIFEGNSETIAVAKKELMTGMKGLLGKDIRVVQSVTKDGCIIIGTPFNK